jgi:hypothetical protein
MAMTDEEMSKLVYGYVRDCESVGFHAELSRLGR